MSEHGHKHAVNENLKFFTKDFVQKYDNADTSVKLSKLVPHLLLRYPDISSITKSPIADGDPLVTDVDFPNQSPFFKPDKTLMDFACGTGIITQHFEPYVNKIIGVDINKLMLEEFHAKLPLADTISVDVLSDDISELLRSVDLIICTISYHHLDNYEEITNKLSQCLKPQGHLFIIDFYNDDLDAPRQRDDNDAESEAVRHMGGLKKEALVKTLKKAALSDIFVDKVVEMAIWQTKDFIKYHCSQKVFDQLDELPSRPNQTGHGNGEEYLIPVSLVLAVGTYTP